jgi:tetratricopeptide (TPR) repeat protein
LFVNLAIAENATQQAAIAEQHFRAALRLAPSIPDSYTYYARFLLEHSRPNEARVLLDRALKLSPSDVFARNLLAQVDRQSAESYVASSLRYYEQGQYEQSIAASRNALSLRPNYAEAWNNICAASNKLGRYPEAAEACEQALRYKPDFELARNNLEYARSMEKGPR